MKSLFEVLVKIYFHPREAFEKLKLLPAPHAGLIAIIGRGFLISMFTYLPVVLMGLEPQIPSSILFIPTSGYYRFLTWFSPIFFLLEWALLGALFYLVLRLFRQPADFDLILNIGGVIDLAVQPMLTLLDWIVFFFSPSMPGVTGVLHWVVVISWITWLSGLAYKKGMGLPWWVGALYCILGSAFHFPLAVLLMRPI